MRIRELKELKPGDFIYSLIESASRVKLQTLSTSPFQAEITYFPTEFEILDVIRTKSCALSGKDNGFKIDSFMTKIFIVSVKESRLGFNVCFKTDTYTMLKAFFVSKEDCWKSIRNIQRISSLIVSGGGKQDANI